MGIITEPFVDAAQLMAGVLGVPDYEFATIGHPIANATEEQFQAWARIAVSDGVKLLTGKP